MGREEAAEFVRQRSGGFAADVIALLGDSDDPSSWLAPLEAESDRQMELFRADLSPWATSWRRRAATARYARRLIVVCAGLLARGVVPVEPAGV